MAVQPIDLQTMYSQMANVATKVSNDQHGAQMMASVQQQNAVIQTAEQLKTVNKAATNEEKTGLIKDKETESSQEFNGNKKEKREKDKELLEQKKTEFREDFLGKHIDITR